MSTETIQELLAELETGTKPYRIDIKPHVDDPPILEIEMQALGNQTYQLHFEHAIHVSNEQDFITPELVADSPVLLVRFETDAQGYIYQWRYVGVSLIYDTFQRKRDTAEDTETVAEYYELGEEHQNDTQQTAWHLTRRDRGEPDVYAFT